MALERDGIEVCAEAASASQAVEAAVRERPDLCLLDIRMPGGGISAASMITFQVPGTIVVMLTVSRNDDDLFESLRRGASGYLLKDGDPSKLPVAVRSALDGQAPLSGDLTAHVIEQFRQRPRARRLAGHPEGRADLTAREWEVLELLVEEVSTAEMAERLFLSQVTVRRHVSNILGKLGVSSREEAVRLAQGDEEPLADPEEGHGPGSIAADASPHAVPAMSYDKPVAPSDPAPASSEPAPSSSEAAPALPAALADADARASSALAELKSALSDAHSTRDREAARITQLEGELADARGALEQLRRENEELTSRLRDQAEADRQRREALESERDQHRKAAAELKRSREEANRLSSALDERRAADEGRAYAAGKLRSELADASDAWARISPLLDDLLGRAERPGTDRGPAPAARPELDELVKTALTSQQRAAIGDAVERLHGRLDAGEHVTELGIGEYDGAVGLLAVTDRRLLVLRPDEAIYQAFPFSEVTGTQVVDGRRGRGSLRVTTRRGDLVLQGRSVDVLERVQVHIRERSGLTAGGSPSSRRLPSSA